MSSVGDVSNVVLRQWPGIGRGGRSIPIHFGSTGTLVSRGLWGGSGSAPCARRHITVFSRGQFLLLHMFRHVIAHILPESVGLVTGHSGGVHLVGLMVVCLPDAVSGHVLAWRSCLAPLTVKGVTSRCFPLSCHLQVLSWTRGFWPTSTPGMGASPRCGSPSAAAFARASATLLFALPMCSMPKDTPRARSRRRAACTSADRSLMLNFRMYDVPRASSTTSVESPRILSLHPSGSTFPSVTSCSTSTRPDHMAWNSAWLFVGGGRIRC